MQGVERWVDSPPSPFTQGSGKVGGYSSLFDKILIEHLMWTVSSLYTIYSSWEKASIKDILSVLQILIFLSLSKWFPQTRYLTKRHRREDPLEAFSTTKKEIQRGKAIGYFLKKVFKDKLSKSLIIFYMLNLYFTACVIYIFFPVTLILPNQNI